MKYKYRLKNKEIENALDVIFGKECVENELQRQMSNDSYFLYLSIDSEDGVKGAIKVSKSEIERVIAHDPNDWNPFPQIKPPAYCHWLVQFESGEIKVIEYVCQEFSPFSVGDFWNAPKLSKVIAFRKLPEPYQPEENK